MIEAGIQGNKRQSFKGANPRDLLVRIVEANPQGTRGQWYFELVDELLSEDGVDYLKSVIEYWFSNNLNSLLDKPRCPPRPPVNRAEKAAKSEAKIKAAITAADKHVELLVDEKVERILLDLEMPNGKPLRDCTGADLSKMEGWVGRMRERVGPKQTVGKVLSEDDVRGYWKASRL
jgi:hypothetical protein